MSALFNRQNSTSTGEDVVTKLAGAAYADASQSLDEAVSALIALHDKVVDMVDGGAMKGASDVVGMEADANEVLAYASNYEALIKRAANAIHEYQKYNSVM